MDGAWPWASAAMAGGWPRRVDRPAGPDLGSWRAGRLALPPGPGGAGGFGVQPRRAAARIASRQQVKLMDAETADEVLTLRGWAQLEAQQSRLQSRVRFSPDGTVGR